MEKQTQKFTDEELLKNEPPVKSGELLEEIKPLLEEYFIGKVCVDGEGIVYTLPNGQKFILNVKAIA